VRNVQLRGGFVSAENEGDRNREIADAVEVHILRELARMGMAAIIANDPRGF